jgi:hypothetical protein
MGVLVMGFLAYRPKETSSTEIVLAFLLGQGFLGSLLHIPALAGNFTIPVLLCLTIPFACFGLWHTYKVSGTVLNAIIRLYHEFCCARLPWQIITLVVGFIFIAGGCSVAAVVTDDARAFYLTLPKVVAASHRLVPLPLYEDFTAVGLLAEVQLAALFLLGMPGGSPRLFCLLTALAGSIVLVTISRRASLSRRGQIISLAMLATSSAVVLLWGSGKTEFFAAAFGLCSYYYAFRSWDAISRKDAVTLAGLFAGFAIVAKLTYVVAFLPGVCILLFWQEAQNLAINFRSRELRLAMLRRCAIVCLLFGTAGLIAFLPQLAKNWILFGDALKTLGGGFQWFSPETTRRIVLTYPLVLIYGNYWGQFGAMSPLLLAFFPLALFAPRAKGNWNGPVVALAVAALGGLVLWVVLFPAVPMPRYFLATLILLFVPASWAAEKFSLMGRMPGHAIWAATLLVLIVFYRMWGGEIFLLRDAFRNIIAGQTEGVPRSAEAESYLVHQALNRIAEPGARVYTLTYFKFHLRPDLIQCATQSNERPSSLDATNPEIFWRQMFRRGFSYVLAEDAYNEISVDSIMKTKPAWVKIEPIAKHGAWGAYRISFENPSEKVLFTTREVAPGAWDVVPAD